MTITITGAQLKAKVIELAEQEPTRQARCYYLSGGEPHCIVGVAIAELAGADHWDEAHEFLRWNSGRSISVVLRTPYQPYDQTVVEFKEVFDLDRRFVQRMQALQDEGYSWGTALSRTMERAAAWEAQQ